MPFLRSISPSADGASPAGGSDDSGRLNKTLSSAIISISGEGKQIAVAAVY